MATIFVNGPVGSGKSYDAINLGIKYVPEFDESFSHKISDFYEGKITVQDFQRQFIEHTIKLQKHKCISSRDRVCDSSLIQHLTFSRLHDVDRQNEAKIVKKAFDYLSAFIIIFKDMSWDYCRKNIVSRSRPYELKVLDDLRNIHNKFKTTFLEICAEYKLPCLIISEPLTYQLLEKIRNPTIDTETVGDVNNPRAFDFGIAWGGGSQGFLIDDNMNPEDLQNAYYPPNDEQLSQPLVSLKNIHKLLRCCKSVYAYNSVFDMKALNYPHTLNIDLWLMTVNYIIIQPDLIERAKETLERTKKGNMRSRFEDLAILICGQDVPLPGQHTARQDAMSEHFLREHLVRTWPGSWTDGQERFFNKYGCAPWYLLNNFDKFLLSSS